MKQAKLLSNLPSPKEFWHRINLFWCSCRTTLGKAYDNSLEDFPSSLLLLRDRIKMV